LEPGRSAERATRGSALASGSSDFVVWGGRKGVAKDHGRGKTRVLVIAPESESGGTPGW
jgi:hypothetical protein